MKRILLFFSLLLALTVSGSASLSAQTESGWLYNPYYETLYRSDTGQLNSITAKGTELTIGIQQNIFVHDLDLRGEIEDINGNKYTIAAIADEAFADNTNLDIVALPATVRKIGNRAFLNCMSLHSIILPESLQNIGKEAFASCSTLANILCLTGQEPVIEDMAFSSVVGASVYAPQADTQEWNNGKWGERSMIIYERPKRTEALDCTVFTENKTGLFDGWEWKHDSKTLILKGVNITPNINTTGMNATVQLPEASTIFLDEGYFNIIKGGNSGGNYSPGIYAASTLRIKGNGILNATGGDSSSSTSSGILSESDITIESGTVTFTGGNNNWLSYGIISNSGTLFVDDGNVTAASGENSASGHGILVIKSVIIYNGIVTAKGKSYGIEAGDRIFISGGSGISGSSREDGQAFNKSPQFSGGISFTKGNWIQTSAEWGNLSGVSSTEITGLSVYGSHNRIYIVNLSGLQLVSVQITDLSGRVVYQDYDEVSDMIETNIASGIYIVKLAAGNGKVGTFKISVWN